LLLAAVALVAVPAQGQSYLDDIGYTALKAELGGNMPTGAGIRISQIEAEEDSNTHAYVPARSSFPNNTISYRSGTAPVSNHATTVGGYLYGSSGAGGGMNPVDVYDATTNTNGWLGGAYLHLLSPLAPNVESSRIQNDSWIGDVGSFNEEILDRLDYAIDRDGFLSVVAVNNDSINPVPALLASGYNSLSVGRSDGFHSFGYTDIVAPLTATSWATPVVSSVAGDLLQVADGYSPLADARHHAQVMKAILMAGATKEQFPTWTRTPTRPLDFQYGAGQVNLYNSYHILTGGEYAPSPSANLPGAALADGWSFQTATPDANQELYYFNVPAGMALRNYSTILDWNRTITQNDMDWSGSMPTFSLQLQNSSNFVAGSTVDQSQSAVDNVQHIYRGTTDPNQPAANELTSGQYLLRVISNFTSTGLSSTDYALAWRGSLVVENPSQVALPGDFNLDGKVDGVDFLNWQSHYGTTSNATFLQGDANGDGKVDGVDFLAWQASYRGGGSAMTVAPEPASLQRR
jgi:hypothetical protein